MEPSASEALAPLSLADQFDVIAVGVEQVDRLAGDVRLDALVRDADGGQVLAPRAERADIGDGEGDVVKRTGHAGPTSRGQDHPEPPGWGLQGDVTPGLAP
jgi:hypothetical protein